MLKMMGLCRILDSGKTTSVFCFVAFSHAVSKDCAIFGAVIMKKHSKPFPPEFSAKSEAIKEILNNN